MRIAKNKPTNKGLFLSYLRFRFESPKCSIYHFFGIQGQSEWNLDELFKEQFTWITLINDWTYYSQSLLAQTEPNCVKNIKKTGQLHMWTKLTDKTESEREMSYNIYVMLLETCLIKTTKSSTFPVVQPYFFTNKALSTMVSLFMPKI